MMGRGELAGVSYVIRRQKKTKQHTAASTHRTVLVAYEQRGQGTRTAEAMAMSTPGCTTEGSSMWPDSARVQKSTPGKKNFGLCQPLRSKGQKHSPTSHVATCLTEMSSVC